MEALGILTATATDIEEAFLDGKLSSEELVGMCLDQISAHDGYLHAIISTPPRGLVLEVARKLDRERNQGIIRGPLHGIPVILKDNIATDPAMGMDTTVGTFALVGSKVKHSSRLVQKLQAAGAIILAKANLSELANFRGYRMPTGWSAVGGLSQSPYVVGGKKWDDGFGGHSAPGGSSSGSCIAVAAGYAPVSIGTDTNGSILMPATRNDVFAMKPTIGLISREGICPICLEFDSAGPIARCARDIAIMMDALVDTDGARGTVRESYKTNLSRPLQEVRFGVLDPREWHLPSGVAVRNSIVDEEIDEEISRAYEKLREIGCTVKAVQMAPLDGLEHDGMSQIQRVMVSGFRHDFEAYLRDLETSKVRTLEDVMSFMKNHPAQEFPPESPNMKRLEDAAAFVISEDQRKAAVEAMRHWGRSLAIDHCLQTNDIDVIIGPADSEMDDLYTAAGYPMAALPLSYSKFNKRPFGVCAIASEYQEGLLIQVMNGWEKVFGQHRILPTWLDGHAESDSAGS